MHHFIVLKCFYVSKCSESTGDDIEKCSKSNKKCVPKRKSRTSKKDQNTNGSGYSDVSSGCDDDSCAQTRSSIGKKKSEKQKRRKISQNKHKHAWDTSSSNSSSSSSSSDSEDLCVYHEDKHNRSEKELMTKKNHPFRLHSELWHNETGQVKY